MSAECDALRQELARIRADIAGLDDRYMAASERIPINSTLAAHTAALGVLATNVAIIDGVAAGAAAAAATALSIAQAAFAAFAIVLQQLSNFVTRARFDALENRVGAVEGGLDVLTRLAQFLSGRIDAVERSIAALAGEVQLVRGIAISARSLAQSAIDAVNEAMRLIRDLEARVRSLEAWRVATVAALAAITAAAAALAAVVAGLSATVAGLVTAVAVLQGEVVALGVAIAALQAEVAALAAFVESQIALITRALARITAELFELGRKIASVEALARLAITYAQLARREAAAALEAAARAFTKATAALATAVEAYQLARAIELIVQILARKLTALEFKVEFIYGLIRVLASRVGTLEQNVLRLQSYVQFLDARISGLSIRVLTLEDILDGVIERLEDIWSALNGTTQGQVNLSPCVETPENQNLISYSGSGLFGLAAATETLVSAVQIIHNNTKCPPAGNAALPMHFETRAGTVPQLVVSWRAVEGGQSKWSFCIPHPKPNIDHNTVFSFPAYMKGNTQLTYTLRNNSKVILNALSESEGLKIVNYVKTLIDPVYINPLATPKITKGAGQGQLREVLVKATYIQKFQGHLSEVALWAKSL